eukprot:SM000303S11794  [mRNA]  locus=s303:2635:5093:- [translate_table: standard]
MVSVNDDRDPHFRKAAFDVRSCPPDCPRPCERVCPAEAISFPPPSSWPPDRALSEPSLSPVRVKALFNLPKILVKAATQSYGHFQLTVVASFSRDLLAFEALWQRLASAVQALRLVAVSIPDLDSAMLTTMASLHSIMQPTLCTPLLWQLDGRPMSGDIGPGATRAAIRLAKQVVLASSKPLGYLQLAGGTNAHTVPALAKAGLFGLKESGQTAPVAGIAYGGYARKVVRQALQMQDQSQGARIESEPAVLLSALSEAVQLLAPLKGYKSESPS